VSVGIGLFRAQATVLPCIHKWFVADLPGELCQPRWQVLLTGVRLVRALNLGTWKAFLLAWLVIVF